MVARKATKRKRSRSRKPLKRVRRNRQKSKRSRSKFRRSKLVSPSGTDFSKMKDPDGMKNIKFDHYIKKIQRRVTPDNALSSDSLRVLNCWMKGMLHQIGQEVSMRMGRRKVIKPKIINKAMKRIIPRNIREEANRKGLQALEKYRKSLGQRHK